MYYFGILVIFFISVLSSSSEIVQNQNEISWTKGQKFPVSGHILEDCQQTRKIIQQKYEQNDKKTFEEALLQREKFQQQYRDKVSGGDTIRNVRIPRRKHIDGRIQHDGKKRLLRSTNNQFTQIDEGNSDQVTDLNFVYSLTNSKVYVHKVQGAKLTEFSVLSFESPLFPHKLHASQGYLAIIFQLYQPNATAVKVYHNSGSNLTEIRSYEKQGLFIASREYNQFLLVLIEQDMKSPTLDYTWTLSDVGLVKQNVYQGMSANKTAKNYGNAARSFGKIPLGPKQNTNYQFATYLLCDFGWDMILTPQLHVYVAGNYYNSSDYAVSIQTFNFEQKIGQTWGSSRWAVLPGLINNNYQMQEFNKFFRVVLLYVDGDWSTPGHVSVTKFPLATFDPKDGEFYRNLGINGTEFTASRFVRDTVYLIFRAGIKTFSTSFGTTTDVLKVKEIVLQLYPYGPNYLVGFGTTQNGNNVAVATFHSNGYKLTLKQTLSLSSTFSYSSYGWFNNQFLQFDWETKRITFPLFNSENEPYKKGYYQIYSDPVENCLSSLPVPSPCPFNQSIEAPVLGKLFKHWDATSDYDYQTGPSQQIRRSATIISEGKYILITGSPCQLQARVIKPFNEVPVMTSSNTSEVSFVDLCP